MLTTLHPKSKMTTQLKGRPQLANLIWEDFQLHIDEQCKGLSAKQILSVSRDAWLITYKKFVAARVNHRAHAQELKKYYSPSMLEAIWKMTGQYITTKLIKADKSARSSKSEQPVSGGKDVGSRPSGRSRNTVVKNDYGKNRPALKDILPTATGNSNTGVYTLSNKAPGAGHLERGAMKKKAKRWLSKLRNMPADERTFLIEQIQNEFQ